MDCRILFRRDRAFPSYAWLGVESAAKRARFADHSRETVDAAPATGEAIAAVSRESQVPWHLWPQ